MIIFLKSYQKIIFRIINNENIMYLDFLHDYKNFDEEGYFDDYLSFEGLKNFYKN